MEPHPLDDGTAQVEALAASRLGEAELEVAPVGELEVVRV